MEDSTNGGSTNGGSTNVQIIKVVPLKQFCSTIEGVEVLKKIFIRKRKRIKFIESTDKVIRSKMKLFALAATTAVNARSWSRVQQPAPGFVNEQGGYWADQPTHPQAPQPNYQVHQPYVQKPQCCEGYTWLSATNEPVWLRKSGEHHDKPYYKGTDESGVERVLFWAFDNTMGSPPVYALSGRWYLSSSIEDIDGAETVSQESYGLRRCPTHHESKPFTNNMDFRCDQQPPQRQQPQQRQCCPYYKWTNQSNTVWMKFNGQTENGKRVYEGVDDGTTKVMFYKPALPGSSFGAWYMGTDVNDPSARQSANVPAGLNSCPDQQDLGWFGSVEMRCEHQINPTPPPPRTCADIADKSILTQSSFEYTECSVEKVMRNLVRHPVTQFIEWAENAGTFTREDINKLHNIDHAAKAWQAMTEGINHNNGIHENTCGFQRLTVDQKPAKTVPNCNNLCADIKIAADFNGSTPENMKLLLEEILFLAQTEFDESKSSQNLLSV